MNVLFSEDPIQIEEYRRRFLHTMEFVRKTFPHGFRRGKGLTETPRARFEAIAIGSYLALKERPDLQPADVSSWLEADPFSQETRSDGANARRKPTSRMNFVHDRLLGKVGE